MVQFYLLVVVGDVEPELRGPFDTEEERDGVAFDYRRDNGDEDGLFPLDILPDCTPRVGSYTNGFFMSDDDEEA